MYEDKFKNTDKAAHIHAANQDLICSSFYSTISNDTQYENKLTDRQVK